MKNYRLFLIYLIMLSISTIYSWEQLPNGPFNVPTINSFFSIGDTLYISKKRTLFSSKDYGITWDTICHPFTGSLLTTNNNDIYALGREYSGSNNYPSNTIIHSNDGGSQWEKLKGSIQYDQGHYLLKVLKLPMFNNTPKVFYAGGANGVMQKYTHLYSSDALFSSGSSTIFTPIKQATNIRDTIIVRTDSTLLITSNGKGFTQIGKLTLPNKLNHILTLDSNLLVSTNKGLFLSTNLDTNFIKLDKGSTPTNFSSIHLLDSVLIGVRDSTFAYSLDTGATWSSPVNVPYFKYAIGKSKIFTYNYNGKVCFSSDYGVTWSSRNFKNYPIVNSIIADDSSCFAISSPSDYHNYSKSNKLWYSKNVDYHPYRPTYDTIYSFTKYRNELYFSYSYSEFINSVQSRIWHGLTKIHKDSLEFEYTKSLEGYNAKVVYLDSFDDTIYTISDIDTLYRYRIHSYNNLNELFNSDLPFYCLYKLKGVLFVGFSSGIFKIIDEMVYNITTPFINVKLIEAIDSTLIVAPDSGGIYTSRDYGNTWSSRNSRLPDLDIKYLSTANNKIIAGNSNGLFISTDMGDNWTIIDSGLPDSNITAVTTYNDTLYVGIKKAGIWRMDISKFSEIPITNHPKSLFKNITVNIKNKHIIILNLPHSKSAIEVSLYSINGKLIFNNIVQNSDLKNKVSLNNNLSSGTYLLLIKSNDDIIYSDKIGVLW